MKHYLIIGASSGIGKALTEILLKEEHQVTATFFSNPIESSEKNLQAVSFDVNGDEEIDFIPDELDGVVYCPGSINLKPFSRIKAVDFVADFSFQVGGAVKVIQKAMPKLKRSAHASIVLFSTVAVQTGFAFHTQVASSKGAIEGLTKALAAEFAPKVRVNCIAPSLTNTPLASSLLNTEEKIQANAQRHPLKKIGEATDIANMAAFLLSDKASWMTGQILHVDGGMGSIKL